MPEGAEANRLRNFVSDRYVLGYKNVIGAASPVNQGASHDTVAEGEASDSPGARTPTNPILPIAIRPEFIGRDDQEICRPSVNSGAGYLARLRFVKPTFSL